MTNEFDHQVTTVTTIITVMKYQTFLFDFRGLEAFGVADDAFSRTAEADLVALVSLDLKVLDLKATVLSFGNALLSIGRQFTRMSHLSLWGCSIANLDCSQIAYFIPNLVFLDLQCTGLSRVNIQAEQHLHL